MGEVRIPKDPAVRAALAKFAGLTDEEAAALDQWCAAQARENAAAQRRGLESVGDTAMAARATEGNTDE
jgi:hypothetical protein